MPKDGVRAQNTIRRYIENWGVRVVDGGLSFRDLVGAEEVDRLNLTIDLQDIGMYHATFCPDGAAEHSVVDVVRRTIFWPATAFDPYMLLHEFAHLLLSVVELSSPEDQCEDGLLAAIEGCSVSYLARGGSGVSKKGWIRWRDLTGDRFEGEGDLDSVAQKYLPELSSMYLFYKDKARRPTPTFWLPAGECT